MIIVTLLLSFKSSPPPSSHHAIHHLCQAIIGGPTTPAISPGYFPSQNKEGSHVAFSLHCYDPALLHSVATVRENHCCFVRSLVSEKNNQQ